MEIIKVSSKSKCSSLAGAIANIIKEKNEVEVHTIGAGALNQLIKSIIICNYIKRFFGANGNRN